MGFWNRKKEEENDYKLNFTEIVMDLFKAPMNLEQLSDLFSDDLDKLIIQGEKENLKYVSGIFTITMTDPDNFMISYKLYFQNQAKQWIVKGADSNKMPLKYLNDDAKKILQEKAKVEYEINPPEKK